MPPQPSTSPPRHASPPRPQPTRRPTTLSSSGSESPAAFAATAHGRPSITAELVPKRRDSSIGATSLNPRLRSVSVIEAAARSPRKPVHTPVDFKTAESKEAMKKLRHVFLPVVLKVVLGKRRRAQWKGGLYPPRKYTYESVVSAITSSKTVLARWPPDILSMLAQEASFHYLLPSNIIVYQNESHLSSGIVVLLHGQLSEERRKDKKTNAAAAGANAAGGSDKATPPDRPIRSQRVRVRYSPDVMCSSSVLCEDRSLSCLSCQAANECADVAVIPSRWFWQVFHNYVLESAQADKVLDSFREDIIPQRTEMLLSTYYPTSVVLQRSWMWQAFGSSDRVKLARSMEVKVLGIGDVLFEEGSRCPYIYVVRRGTLTVIVKGEPLAIAEAGVAFGEESLLFDDTRSSSVVAGSVCELYALHLRELKHRLDKYPKLLADLVPRALERRQKWMETGRVRDIFGLVSLLSGVPCLSHTTDPMRESIAKTATVVSVPAGQKLMARDSPCDALYVIGRGCVRVGGVLDPGKPYTAFTHAGESRSAGDFFGELCLRSHLWPVDVVSESSVDLWVLQRDELLAILATNKADAQAEEVCRQGIALYRAQHGDESMKDGLDAQQHPHTPSTPSNAAGKSLASSRRSSLAQRNPLTSAHDAQSRRRSSSMKSGGRSPSNAGTTLPSTEPLIAAATDLKVEYESFNWVEYSRAKLQDGIQFAKEAEEEDRQNGTTGASKPHPPARELRPTDKNVEKAMSAKVITYISLPQDNEPCTADADFPGEVNELQAIIVEQLMLTPSDDQPRFLQQIGNSNVKLIAADEEDISASATHGGFGGVGGPLESMADVGGDADLAGEDQFFSTGSVVKLQVMPTLGECDGSDDNAQEQSRETSDNGIERSQPFCPPTNDMLSFGSFPANSPATRGRRSVFALDDSGLFSSQATLGMQPRASISRSHLVRPPSGMPVSPRNNAANGANALAEFISPRGTSLRPPSSSEPRFPSISPARRPTSVDYTQQNKLSMERSASLLDRYVKIEDQGYFNSLVKVVPLQQDELWDPEEASGGGSPDTLILTLMHVQSCERLDDSMMEDCAQPVLRVSTGGRTLVSAPFLGSDKRASRWPIEVTSFITLVRRGVDIKFEILDGAAHDKVEYHCALSTADINENGGVGQRVMSLRPDADPPLSDQTARPPRARLTVTMMAVTASRYKALRDRLEPNSKENEASEKDKMEERKREDTASAYVQIIGVDELKHRVEASVAVTMESEGATSVLSETPRITPKTRTPCWPANDGLVHVVGEGDVTFGLNHKGSPIGTYKTTADELIFGGLGIRRLPLTLTHTPNEVIGKLVVRVVATTTPSVAANKNATGALFLHTESFTMGAAAADKVLVVPDPLILLRNGTGDVVLKTPMAIGSLTPSWAPEEASCFLPCPELAGSQEAYQLEVRDNDVSGPSTAALLGSTTLNLTRDGLGTESRYDVPLDGHRGTVRVMAMRFPIMQPFATDRRGSHAAAHAAHFTKDDALVLVHVSGCKQLHWTDSSDNASTLSVPYMQVEAVVTMKLLPSSVNPYAREENVRQATECLRTGIARSSSDPTWPLQAVGSAALLQFSENDLQRAGDDEGYALFEVYDGLVDKVDLLGQAIMPMRMLLTTGHHCLRVRSAAPPAKAPAFDDESSSSSSRSDSSNGSGRRSLVDGTDDGDDEGVTAGVLVVETFAGRLGAQVAAAGTSGTTRRPSLHDTHEAALTVAADNLESPSGEATLARGSAAQVLLRLTAATNLVRGGTDGAAAETDEPDVRVTVTQVAITAAQSVLMNWKGPQTKSAPAQPVETPLGETTVVFAETGGPGDTVLDTAKLSKPSTSPDNDSVRIVVRVRVEKIASADKRAPSEEHVLSGALPFDTFTGVAVDAVLPCTFVLSGSGAPVSPSSASMRPPPAPGHGAHKPKLGCPCVSGVIIGLGSRHSSAPQARLAF